MSGPNLPEWWRDVHRSLSSAFSEYSEILSAIQIALSAREDGSQRSQRRRSQVLSDLSGRLIAARIRIKSAINLAMARADDVAASGLRPIPLTDYRKTASRLVSRGARLGEALALRMEEITREQRDRRTRRPNKKIFGGEAPSQIDLSL